MHKKTIISQIFAVVIALTTLVVLACSQFHDEASRHHEEEVTTEQKDVDGHDSHAEHGHSEEKSDLDRPVDELLAAVCEHNIPTHQCTECRYEVGVVRVPKDLIDEGLIRLTTVSRQAGETAVELTGEIVLDERAVLNLSPLAPGVVVRVMVDLGQQVKSGQALLLIRSAELARAQSEFLEADSRLKLALKTYERQKSLRESGINSERDLLEAEQEWASCGIRVEAARQSLINLGMNRQETERISTEGMQAATGELLLRTPLSGVVLELNASAPGEQVGPDKKAVLIGDPSRLWLWANLYELELPGVMELRRQGAGAVSVTVSAYPGETFPGSIDFVGSLMDEKTRTVRARISLTNKDGRLHAGMFAGVRVLLPSGNGALALPSAAILSDADRDFVFVRVRDDYFIRRPVYKGAERDGMTGIKLGVEEGQEVISDGAFLLKSDVLRSKMGAGCAD